jgi:hypothetical protein
MIFRRLRAMIARRIKDVRPLPSKGNLWLCMRRIDRRLMRKQLIQLLIATALCCAFTSAQQLKPLPGTSVHDFANVISAESEKQLQEKARRLKG